MENNHKISVIMGIYNCERTLSDAIESILCQTYTNWELIMCDDGSVDETYKIAFDYSNKYDNIRVIKNESNLGLNKTLNKCLKLATGKYIARMDGDDVSVTDRFEKEIAVLEKDDYAIVSAQMVYFDEHGEWGYSKTKEKPQKEDFIRGTPFCHAPCMVKKEAFDLAGGYSENPRTLRVEDYDLWFRLYALGYKGYNIQEVLYRVRDDQNAIKRRTLKNRFNEMYVKYTGFRRINIKKRYYVYCLRPLLVAIIPKRIYGYLRRKWNKV